MMWSLPNKKDLACGRSRPCVSEMIPMRSMASALSAFHCSAHDLLKPVPSVGPLNGTRCTGIKWNDRTSDFHRSVPCGPPVLQYRPRGKSRSATWRRPGHAEPVQGGRSLWPVLQPTDSPACAALFLKKGEVP